MIIVAIINIIGCIIYMYMQMLLKLDAYSGKDFFFLITVCNSDVIMMQHNIMKLTDV